MLEGKRLRYLIGSDNPYPGSSEYVTEVGYDVTDKAKGTIAYCNFYDEKNSGKYGPYLSPTDTAGQYGESVPDPAGPGFMQNLADQFETRRRQGFDYVEIDNPDGYAVDHVLRGVALAATYSLAVVAKNPLLFDSADAVRYVAECCGVIVERNCGDSEKMDRLRRAAGKPSLPVWFVSFGSIHWIRNIAAKAWQFDGMFCSHSPGGEYTTSVKVP